MTERRLYLLASGGTEVGCRFRRRYHQHCIRHDSHARYVRRRLHGP